MKRSFVEEEDKLVDSDTAPPPVRAFSFNFIIMFLT
jgi:hypothetical protein